MIQDLETFVIENPKLTIPKKPRCFLYEFPNITEDELTEFFNGKVISLFSIERALGITTKCPWCGEKTPDMKSHIKKHGKKMINILDVRVSDEAYKRLLFSLRNGAYDTLLFSLYIDCPFCINPKTKGREGKCAIPESSRNKFRSFKRLKFSCDGFNPTDKVIAKYQRYTFALVYRRHPVDQTINSEA